MYNAMFDFKIKKVNLKKSNCFQYKHCISNNKISQIIFKDRLHFFRLDVVNLFEPGRVKFDKHICCMLSSSTGVSRHFNMAFCVSKLVFNMGHHDSFNTNKKLKSVKMFF